MMNDDYPTHSHWHRRNKGFPWIPFLAAYIGILLAAALLSGVVANSARRERARQQAQNEDQPTQAALLDETGPAQNGKNGKNGNGANGSSGQSGSVNGGRAGTAQGSGQTGQAQGNGQTAPGGEVTIGDSYTAPDRQNVPADQSAPAEEPAPDPSRIEVESISITSDITWMRQGESVQLFADITPDNATDPSIQWRSSNEGVAYVTPDGQVVSVGGGPVVISATSSNGLTVDFPMDVSTKEKWMKMNVSRSEEYNDSVGDDWDFEYAVNGVAVSDSEDMLVVLGDTITVTTTITDYDENPDVGMTEGSFTVDEMSFANGFEMEQEIFVNENEGEAEGNEAAFLVTYSFTNAE